jgi:hypothetical protein
MTEFYLPFAATQPILRINNSNFTYYTDGVKCWYMEKNNRVYKYFSDLLLPEEQVDTSWPAGNYHVLESFKPILDAMRQRQKIYEAIKSTLCFGLMRQSMKSSLMKERQDKETILLIERERQVRSCSSCSFWQSVLEVTIEKIEAVTKQTLLEIYNQCDYNKPHCTEQRDIVNLIWQYADIFIPCGHQYVKYYPYRPYSGGPN